MTIINIFLTILLIIVIGIFIWVIYIYKPNKKMEL